MGCYPVSRLACQAGSSHVDFAGQHLHLVVRHGDAGSVEGVGFDNVRARLKVGDMNVANEIRLSQYQKVVVALDVQVPIGKAFATVIRLRQLALLDHGAHAAIKHQDTLVQ